MHEVVTPIEWSWLTEPILGEEPCHLEEMFLMIVYVYGVSGVDVGGFCVDA